MKKVLLIIPSSFFILLSLVYTLAFTSFGNNLLKPYIEDKLNESSPILLRLKTFHLDMSSLNILIELGDKNDFLAQGQYSLFTQNFDINYELKLLKLSAFNKVIKKNLKGELSTSGKVKGTLQSFKITGTSALAQSDTKYSVLIENMQIDKSAIKLSHAHIQDLLSMIGEKAYAKGNI
ncbi:hypothetical protein JHD50_09015, partial [Sulfurimonas sp. MAG313]|nr:hypothetical protein [Sulfurimonas sp. MAG313]